MIIWLASYPRSGNTLLRQVLRSAFGRSSCSRYDDLTDIGADPALRDAVGHEFLARPWAEAYPAMRAAEALFFVKTHDAPADDERAIYVVRDGRAAVSSYHRYLQDFVAGDARLSMADVVAGYTQFGSWGSHLDAWQPERRADTLLLRYEEIVRTPRVAIERIAEFAGIEPTGDWHNDFEGLQRLSPKFFRRGAHVDPENLLDDETAGLFARYHGDWMARLGYWQETSTESSAVAVRRQSELMGVRMFEARQQEASLRGGLAALRQELEAVRRVAGHRPEPDAGPCMPVRVVPPTQLWPLDEDVGFQRSWPRGPEGDEQSEMAAEAQLESGEGTVGGVGRKLFEMGQSCGRVILEIGLERPGGLAAMRGARSAGAGSAPQYYAVDPSSERIAALRTRLVEAGCEDRAVVFHGEVADFLAAVPIGPSMVIVGAELVRSGARPLLGALQFAVEVGVPVLCRGAAHDGELSPELRAAIAGYQSVGVFGGALLLRAGPRCRGRAARLAESTFAALRAACTGAEDDGTLAAAAARARRDLRRGADVPGAGGRGAWPWVAPRTAALPPTLPGGAPWPKISIVTPSYNQGEFIEETILSVLHQGYPSVEHIVIDGGSTDATAEVLERYSERLSYVVSEKDNGQSDAINKGMARATGEIVTWINSDDRLAPGALAAMAMAFHTSGADLVCGVCELYRDGVLAGRHLTSCAAGPLPLEQLLDLEGRWTRGQFFYQPEVMFTRALWQRAGGRVDESLYYSMDYEMWLRFARAGARLHVIGAPIAQYRVHEEQKTFSQADYGPELAKVRDAFAAAAGVRPALRREARRAALRVVFFNDMGWVGGAGIAQLRLVKSLALIGQRVEALAIAPHLSEAKSSVSELIAAIADRQPDLVVLGNVHSARLPAELPGAIAARWPVVQVMHDLWSLTGRCAYTGDCTKFESHCDHTCPTAYDYPVLEPPLIAPAYEAKRAALAAERGPVLAGVSAWTESVARRCFPGATSPRIIGLRYGLEIDVFRPRDPMECRQALGLPPDKFIVLFSATCLSDERKGLAHLLEALRRARLSDLLAVCVGHVDIGEIGDDVAVKSLGYVGDPLTLAMAYSAADVFVGPSLIETFGQVFIEAAAAGTPSIGYPAGGVREAVAHGVSGLLADAVDPGALATALVRLHQNPTLRRDLGRWGRQWVENEWSLRSSGQRFAAQLEAVGLAEELGVPPRFALGEAAGDAPAVAFLESERAAGPPTTNGSNGTMMLAQGHLRERIARLEAERARLRATLDGVTQTRLWRLVARTYPVYTRVMNHPRVPRLAKASAATMMRWFSRRS